MTAVTEALEFGLDVPSTALYRLYDSEGELLYVGITDNPAARMAQHRTQKAWWGDVSRTTITWYASRREALAAESSAIRDERPGHNVAGASPVKDAQSVLRTGRVTPLEDAEIAWAWQLGFEFAALMIRSQAEDLSERAERTAAHMEKVAATFPRSEQLKALVQAAVQAAESTA